MKRYETPRSACSSTSRLRIAAWTETSSAEVGSSQTTSFGSPAKARAIATRCLRPPDSWPGFCVERPLGEPHAPGERRAGAPRPPRPPIPASFFSERSRIRRTAWRRFSAESGFWKTIWIARRSSFVRFW